MIGIIHVLFPYASSKKISALQRGLELLRAVFIQLKTALNLIISKKHSFNEQAKLTLFVLFVHQFRLHSNDEFRSFFTIFLKNDLIIQIILFHVQDIREFQYALLHGRQY